VANPHPAPLGCARRILGIILFIDHHLIMVGHHPAASNPKPRIASPVLQAASGSIALATASDLTCSEEFLRVELE
jgi:hypothetical protein